MLWPKPPAVARNDAVKKLLAESHQRELKDAKVRCKADGIADETVFFKKNYSPFK